MTEPEQPNPDRSAPTGNAPPVSRQSYILLVALSGVTLALDLITKWWALTNLEDNGSSSPIELTSWFGFVLARNHGGAWGMLQTADPMMRRPFFLVVSVLAIAFIVYLHRRTHPKQFALRWGLPLVLGGALGNLVDRIRYGWVVDFIDYQAGWVESLNSVLARVLDNHAVTNHWPTFNVADIAICIGVGLMAVDMFTSRQDPSSESTKKSSPPVPAESTPPAQSDS